MLRPGVSEVRTLPVPAQHPAEFAHRARLLLFVLAIALLQFAIPGCGRLSRGLTSNQPPTISLTSGPVDTLTDSLSWIVDIGWIAHDPDGSIDHFEYAVDPPTMRQAALTQSETTWVSTTANHATVRFRASRSNGGTSGSTASDFHVFALRAVDDRGGFSPLVVRAFYSYTVAPDVAIRDPAPIPLFEAVVAIPFRVRWQGDDPDGDGTRAPTAYRMRILDINGDVLPFLLDPDSLRRFAVATEWAGWRTITGDTSSIVLDGTTVEAGHQYLLALVAVDEAGASTPYMDFSRNLLVFTVDASKGPRLHVTTFALDYTSTAGSAFEIVETTIFQSQPMPIRWEGLPTPGREILATRWVLDPADLNDETPRTDEDADWSHWSRWRSGPDGGVDWGSLSAGVRRFYIQARDDFGAVAMILLKITTLEAPSGFRLLVVDDTRLEVDKFSAPGIPMRYTQPWPSAAELDTFLYARGGFPWRGARNPAGALSVPGLLAGYSFDTLGTRRGYEDPSRAISPITLRGYGQVLWIVDAAAALHGITSNAIHPMTALRAMCAPGHSNDLVSFNRAGGRVWFAGGGAACASLIDYNNTVNDVGTILFTFDDHELTPGRVMYDLAHVRSALAIERHPGDPRRSPSASGARLPATLRMRTADTDPIPPTRDGASANLYYPSTVTFEYVAAPNAIVEDADIDPTVVRLESALDTLYVADQPIRQVADAPVMLYYHGRENAPFVFTGFDLWSWSRDDGQALVDFVLQDVWGMTKASPAGARGSAAAARPARSVARTLGTRSP